MSRAASLREPRGFTLLEVMVAIAILGLSLTMILAAQAGSFAAASHARKLSLATGLARCKMSELEAGIAADGLPSNDEAGAGACCEDDTASGIACAWRVEAPVLPDPALGALDLDADLDLGSPGGGGLGALGLLGSGAGSFGSGATPGDVAQQLAGASAGDPMAAAGAVSQGLGGIESMLMSFAYPSLKQVIETSSRRITVTASWNDGGVERTFEVVQWVVAPPGATL